MVERAKVAAQTQRQGLKLAHSDALTVFDEVADVVNASGPVKAFLSLLRFSGIAALLSQALNHKIAWPPLQNNAQPSTKPNPPMEITPTADPRALAKMVATLFEHWQLSTADQAALLGLSLQQRAAVARYRQGAPLRHDRDTRDRVGHLLAIHASLRQLFPQNRQLAYRWMSTQNKAFDDNTPVEVVQTWGFAGLLRVRAYLDRAQRR